MATLQTRFNYARLAPGSRLLATLAFALFYTGLAIVSVKTTQIGHLPSAFWPVAGLALAILYLFGLGFWPAIFIGALFVNHHFNDGFYGTIGLSLASTLESVLGTYLLRRFGCFEPGMSRLRDVLLFLGVGLSVSFFETVFALLVIGSGHALQSPGWGSIFPIWWLGNTLGIFIVTPFLLAWTQPDIRKNTPASKVELIIVFTLGLIFAWFIFCRSAFSIYFSTIPFLAFLFVVWTALRFGAKASTLFVLLLGSIVMWGTLSGVGPFGHPSPSHVWESTGQAQVFTLVCAVASLLVSAITSNLHERSERLEGSERRYRQLFDSGPDPLWIYNPANQQILAVNECAIHRLGYSREEFLRLRVSQVFGNSPSLPPINSTAKTSRLSDLPASLRTRGGDEIKVRVSYRSVDFFGESSVQLLAQDVSEQVRVEDDLRRSEQKLNMHIEQTALGVIEWDRDFMVMEWNPAAERIFGYEKHEIIGQPSFVLVPEDMVPRVEDIWEKILGTAAPVRSVNENLTKSGERIICEWFNTPLVSETGIVIGAASLVQDVTLQESIKQSIRESEEKFRSVIESSPMGIQIYEMQDDDRLVLIGANPAAQNFMGFRNEAVLGKTIEQAFPSLAETSIPRMYRRAAREGFASWTDQIIYDGKEMLGAYEVNAFQTVPGKMVAMFLDVTERRKTEQTLRLRDKAMEAISQGIVILSKTDDDALPIIYANPAFEKITGYCEKDILGKSWRALTGVDSEVSEVKALALALGNAQPVSAEMRSYRQDGTTFQSAISFSPILDADGMVSHFVGVYTDITSIKKLESQFRQSQKMEAIGRLAGGVAHDFNNLLTAIIGYNDINLDAMEAQTALSNNSLEIQKAAERAASLTGQMLAFSRQQNLQPTRVGLNKLISGMHQMLARLIGETIEIKTSLEEDLADIKAGTSQIEQVILNLAINARDAMPAGGLLSIRTSNVRVDRSLAADIPGIQPGEYVLLAVSDNGTGMDDHTKEHLFEPFFTTKEKGKGTGLGLATSYGIITQSSGYISVHSLLGRGTTFDVYFPKMPAGKPRDARTPEEPAIVGGSETILVVEDDPAVRPLTTNILRSYGYRVIEATDGLEAQIYLESGASEKIDLLLTDVVMPRMGGKELADWVKQAFPTTKILFTSGYLENPLSREDIGVGEANFLRKPFAAKSLARKIRDALDRKEVAFVEI